MSSNETVLRVLVVEDHDDSRLATVKLLRRSGYDVSAGATLAEARTLASADRYDVIICDQGLPDGNGCDLLRGFGAGARPRRAISLSGDSTAASADEARAAGFDTMLTKPIDFTDLLRAIGGLLPRD